MCTPSSPQQDKSNLAVPPPTPPALGSGMLQKSRLTIQGRKKQIDEQIAAAGG